MFEGKYTQGAALLSILLVFSFFGSCEIHKITEIAPEDIDPHIQNLKTADSLYAAGSYTCLKEAYDIYEELLAIPFEWEATSEKLFKTALLLGMRVKELGIINAKYVQKAEELISTYPHLSKFESYIKFSATIPYTIKGVVLGFQTDEPNLGDYYGWIKNNAQPLNDAFKANAETTEFHAYLYMSFFENFSYQIDEEYDFHRLEKFFPDSPMIKYKVALLYDQDKDKLEDTLEAEPRFTEAHLFLGKKAFEGKKLLTAEKHFRKAYEILPDSLSVLIFLAGVHFALEENEESVGFYEDALCLAPEFREALLGKAVCLGYMGKHEYAVLVLNELIEMGRYYMGESYFWLAWNQNEMELIEESQKNVKKTENYLVGHVEVLALQGKIAFKLGKLEESEDYFNQALILQRNHCEAEYHLAKIHALREDWENTGIHYEKAAYCYKNQEAGLAARIKEIGESPMSLERKARLILRKKAQLRKTALTKATCFYNGAAGYFNCGKINKALVFASYAAEDEAFAAKAEELIKMIENK
jgi:tetratricopeptide (TPR) repeat protein